MKKTNAWIFYGSYGKNPLLLLLEIIWTRLTYYFKINSSELFEGYLNEELIRPLLIGKPHVMGWEYIIYDISKQELLTMCEEQQWEPTEISICENVIFMKLCRDIPVYLNDIEFIEFLESQGENVNEIVEHLTKNRLIYVKGNEIKLITDGLQVVCTKDGFFAADTKDNRFYEWLKKMNRDYNYACF